MLPLRERLATLNTDAAMRLVVDVRHQLFEKVKEMRAAHLKDGGKLSDRTRESYAADARRVADSGGNLALLAGTAASFRKLRAACLWKAREDLRECLARADRARKKGSTGDIEALCIYDETLPSIENRIQMLSALRFADNTTVRRDKTHCQRNKLGRLPVDWIGRIHARTKEGIYGEAIAVGILIPVRPEEITNRINVKFDTDGALRFEVKGSKLRERGSGIASHVEGIGQPVRILRLSAVDIGRQDVFDWLSKKITENGGEISIGKGLSASGICSAFRSMSRREFNRQKSPPSFYALRHAACSELKASGISLEEVAEGMGHSSVLSQKVYGMRSQASGGYVIEATASRPVRANSWKGSIPSADRKIYHAERPRKRVLFTPGK